MKHIETLRRFLEDITVFLGFRFEAVGYEFAHGGTALVAGLASAGGIDHFHTEGPHALDRTDHSASESRRDSIGKVAQTDR